MAVMETKNGTHIYTWNEKKVPGVTTITNIVNKPFLVKWAYNLGKNGVDMDAQSRQTLNIGKLVHSMIQSYFEKSNSSTIDNEVFDGISDIETTHAKRCFRKFLNWSSQHTIKPILLETSLVSNLYGGTFDALLDIDGKIVLMDWKTSNTIYPEYFAQVSAYWGLISQHKQEDDRVEELIRNNRVETIAVFRMPKDDLEDAPLRDDNWDIVEIAVDSHDFSIAYQYFYSCLRLYQSKSELEKNLGGNRN
ncbi:MAG: hypothetical protein ACYDAO_02830 [Thermoplasmataceae archaeon]